MANPAASPRPAGAGRDLGYHPLRVRRVVQETPDASSLVLEIPEADRDSFTYEAGQFCTFRVTIDGVELSRCYSMSSSPAVDDELQVTVKRVPGGAVSNWLNDNLGAGDVLEAMPPSGLFRLGPGEGDIVAFAGGSGITPIFSILKTALATTDRRVRVLYANRVRESVIFDAALEALAAEHPGRLHVVHHLDVEHGFVGADEVGALLDGATDPELFVCGPGPFMDIVESTLHERGVDPARIRIERFTVDELPAPADPEPAEASTDIEVTITLKGKTATATYAPGTTLIQVARQLGMSPPFSCEAGNCASCMAQLTEGAATMRANNALTPEEVTDGWVLTCQAVPTTPTVRVVYE